MSAFEFKQKIIRILKCSSLSIKNIIHFNKDAWYSYYLVPLLGVPEIFLCKPAMARGPPAAARPELHLVSSGLPHIKLSRVIVPSLQGRVIIISARSTAGSPSPGRVSRTAQPARAAQPRARACQWVQARGWGRFRPSPTGLARQKGRNDILTSQ